MGIKKTLGGDRLGSGNRMKAEMHNFYRSNHNLSKSWKSSMAAGVLYPCYCNVGLDGDTFDIDINAFLRTIPTRGPLFGSFKMQIDFFRVPIRLYNGLLHNNAVELGLDMDKVMLPKMTLSTSIDFSNGKNWALGVYEKQISSSSLTKYLGISGIAGTARDQEGSEPDSFQSLRRTFNGVPILAYYDIFKNYYSNKQEENAYVISAQVNDYDPVIEKVLYDQGQYDTDEPVFLQSKAFVLQIIGQNITPDNVFVRYDNDTTNTLREFVNKYCFGTLEPFMSIKDDYGTTYLTIKTNNCKFFGQIYLETNEEYNGEGAPNDIKLVPFPLKNIDQMRKYCLNIWDLGDEIDIADYNWAPYNVITGVDPWGYTLNKYVMNGLCVKTYQSDLFNNWLDNEFIAKIDQLSKVSIVSNSISINALNFAKKVYEMYNRIAISGGTYNDWQEAVYGQKVWGKSEIPIYCGGMSSEVVFEEVVSTAATEEDALGSLGGRGKLNGRNGGSIVIKCDEACFIMGIVSLTPRIDYTQGNKWYMTDLDSIDDLHKPNMDQIGFQDLITEHMAWWDTTVSLGDPKFVQRKSAGKQPAWINYMTDVDEAFGDFAEDEGKSFMVLSRQYEYGERATLLDVTTYIDPTKFNYAFAYTELAAQNFWGFINFDIKARRLMSATQIPNF